MSQPDYYKILNVSKEATQDEIKKAYRKLAKQYHPDQSTNSDHDTAKFKEATTAYEVLSDKTKRGQYDRGELNQAGVNFRPNTADTTYSWGGWGVDDIFNSVMNGGSFHRTKPKGQNVEVLINLTLEEVATGVEKQVSFQRTNACVDCNSLGGIGKRCNGCGGQGRVRHRTSAYQQVITSCPTCKGSGVEIEKICTICQGYGKLNENKTIQIKITAGVSDGDVLSAHNMGCLSSTSSLRGDLLCHIKVKPHPVFTRDGNHLGCSAAISIVDACLGTDFSLSTIYGEKIKVKIPASVQSGHILKVSNKGLPGHGKNGDLFVKVRVETPKQISNKAKKLLTELKKELS